MHAYAKICHRRHATTENLAGTRDSTPITIQRRALRLIGAELIGKYRDKEIRETRVAQNEIHRDRKRKARWRVRRTLWQIYLDPVTHMLLATEERPHESPRVGSIERWVETSKAKKGLQGKVQHAVRCLQQYTVLVTRP